MTEKIRLIDIGKEHIGKEIEVKIQPQYVSQRKVVPVEIQLFCNKCKKNKIIKRNFEDLLKEVNMGSLCGCPDKYKFYKILNYLHCWFLKALDPPQLLRFDELKNRKSLDVWYVSESKTFFNQGVLNIKGVVVTTGRLPYGFGIISNEIKSQEEFYLNYEPTKEDMLNFEKYFTLNQNLWDDVNNLIAPTVVGRSFEKKIISLALHSPIFDVGRVCLLGDGSTGKSWILGSSKSKNSLIEITPLGCEYITGESSSRTGITYFLSQDPTTKAWDIEFGVLPKTHGLACFIDGLQGFPHEEWSKFREILSQGVVRVVRVGLDIQSPAQTRIIAGMNLDNEKEVDSFPSKWDASFGSKILNSIDRRRFDFVLVLSLSDVDDELIDKSHFEMNLKKINSNIPVDVYKKHLMWAWKLKEDDIIIPEETLKKLYGEVSIIKEKYKHETTKPFLPDFFELFKKLCIELAIHKHNVEDGKVIVSEDHVSEAKNIFDEYYEHLQLERKLLLEEQTFSDIDVLASEIFSSDSEVKKAMFMEIWQNSPIKNKEILEKLNCSKQEITNFAKEFDENDLIERAGVYKITKKGALVGQKIAKMLGALKQEDAKEKNYFKEVKE